MDTGLAGRVALVTGATRGIGFAIAEALRAEDADVVVLARSKDGVDDAVSRLGTIPMAFVVKVVVHGSSSVSAIAPDCIGGPAGGGARARHRRRPHRSGPGRPCAPRGPRLAGAPRGRREQRASRGRRCRSSPTTARGAS